MSNIMGQNDVLFTNVYNEISELIKAAKSRVQIALISEMMLLYWQVGRTIRSEILRNQNLNMVRK